jgi:hypothetical protein
MPSGKARVCKTLTAGSIPAVASESNVRSISIGRFCFGLNLKIKPLLIISKQQTIKMNSNSIGLTANLAHHSILHGQGIGQGEMMLARFLCHGLLDERSNIYSGSHCFTHGDFMIG